MFLRDGHCAYCDRKLPHDFRTEEFNKHWRGEHKPFMCSQRCFDKAKAPYFTPDKYDDPRAHKGHIEELRRLAMDAMYKPGDDVDDVDLANAYNEREVEEFRFNVRRFQSEHAASYQERIGNALLAVEHQYAKERKAEQERVTEKQRRINEYHAPLPTPTPIHLLTSRTLDHISAAPTAIKPALGRLATELAIRREKSAWHAPKPDEIFSTFVSHLSVPLPEPGDSPLATLPFHSFLTTEKLRSIHDLFVDGHPANRFKTNLYELAGKPFDPDDEVPTEDLWKGLKPTHDELLALFRGTPLEAFLMSPVPIALSDEIKFQHTWVLAASGAGKSSLLFREVTANLQRAEPPAMVIVDPKGILIGPISRLAEFDPDTGRHKDRLVIVDPSDLRTPIAMNMFARPQRVSEYTDAQRRQIENQTISQFNYVFDSRSNALTAKQSQCFAYVTRLILSVPNSNIQTMLDFLSEKVTRIDDSQFIDYINQLPTTAQRFFKTTYLDQYSVTRGEIAQRIYGLLEKPEVDAMLSARERKLDMFELLQQRKTVIINLPKALLGDEGVELLGRYFISLTLASVFERITIPEAQWAPSFIYIDEGQTFADETKLPEMLELARQFLLGVMFINHDTESQLSHTVRSALATNTAIKYVSNLGGADRRFMASEMSCEPELLEKARAVPHVRANFLVHAKGVTHEPMMVTFPLGEMVRAPKMSAASHAKLLAENRKRLAPSDELHEEEPVPSIVRPAPVAPPNPPPPTPPPPRPRQPVAQPQPIHTDDSAEPSADWKR